MAAFFPKFLEAQFNFTPDIAAVVAAALAVPSAAVGVLLGSWATKQYDMSVESTLSFCKWVTFISIPILLVFLVPCESQDFAGVNIGYMDQAALLSELKNSEENSNSSVYELNFDAFCNQDCNCLLEDYYPICGADKIQYYSPCYAGCVSSSKVKNSEDTLFTNCSCV